MQDILEEMIQIIDRQRKERTTRQIATEKDGTSWESSKDGMTDAVCPYCGGSGWEIETKIIDGADYEYAKKCRCQLIQRHIVESRIKFMDLPKAYKYHRMKDFKINVYRSEQGRSAASTACRAVKYWLNHLDDMVERGKGLYFYSKTKGSGKTRMAASLANELMHKHNMQVKFATSIQIINEIKASWNDHTRDESKLLDALSMAQILVLDDFGTEQEGNEKAWINERLYHIINKRYIDKKITIFTSNMDVDNLQYDERITNRIKEITFQVMFPEESVRDYIADDNRKELMEGMMGLNNRNLR